MARPDFYLVERPDPKYGPAHFAVRQIRRQGRIWQPLLLYPKGFERRWVIYAGESEGSMTPPGWYGWLHHTVDIPPTAENYAARAWELPHQPNMTGAPQDWRPPGSTLAANARPPATGDYEAWTPEG
jgi:NADH:ubiquinone oxidoreductase subunit